jgi:protein gp37
VNVTSIQWTNFSANPLKYRDQAGKVVWACIHESPGCINCYAEGLAKRWHRGGSFNVPTMNTLTPFLDEKELESMRTVTAIKGKPVSGGKAFVCDMTDLFGDWVSDDLLDQLYSNVLEHRRDVTWQILTKRAKRMCEYLTWRYKDRIAPRHIWHGVSAEDQPRLDARLQWLLQTPSAVRFLSIEPLINHLQPRLSGGFCRACKQYTKGSIDGHCFEPTSPCFAGEMFIADGIDWVIVGGESGYRSRQCNVAWVRSIKRDCQRNGVPVFVKQLGSFVVDRNDTDFDGSSDEAWPVEIERREAIEEDINGFREEYQGAPVRVRLIDLMGGTPAEWPLDLRVREFPRRRR